VRRLAANPWLRLAALVAALLAFGLLLGRLSGVLTPFAVAFGLAYFLNPVVNWLERVFARLLARRPRLGRLVAPRAAAVGLLCAAMVVALAGVLLVVVPTVAHQVSDAAAKLPGYIQTLRARVEPLVERVSVRYPQQIEELRVRGAEWLRGNAPGLLQPLTRMLQAAFSSVLAFVLALLNLFVIPVFAVYLLFDMNRIREGIKELVPPRFRDYVYTRARAVDRLLSAFVRGQITVCLILGSFYAVGLTACGVPMGIPVGLLIGFFNLIPFMSYILGLPLALVLAWVDDPDPRRLVIVAVLFTMGQFVEGNFITPRIVGESLGLHAVVIMLAVIAGGTLFGFVGMLLAVPVTAALSIFWADLRAAYLRSSFYADNKETPG
jgi:predicted PurR-regulated permease PerM